ncbi:MAG: restriction endonuclease [Gammaproteobacteria bacterium AqS3]|nr:restriction endonuclease [Gammaproteobacteria bacterium AqS3]
MIEHDFTYQIQEILQSHFGNNASTVLKESELLEYLNIKTKSATRGSKSRGSFANHYAIYVLVEDYIKGEFDKNNDYENYEGARYSDLLSRQRELPFGSKLQNHALNHRMNQEFKKYFPTCEYIPILRNSETNRYWINENLLKISVAGAAHNIAYAVIEIIDAYIDIKTDSFHQFIASCEKIQQLQSEDPNKAQEFITSLIQPNMDARIFEIVSFAILKEYYADQVIYWGWTLDSIQKASLILHKTGRTNANDGGIDFVMHPLGRFFQVTETTDVRKHFLDIDKVQRFPVTFVIKSSESIDVITNKISAQAKKSYGVAKIVRRYMECIEEIINVQILLNHFNKVVENNRLQNVIEEIVLQSKVEFNYYQE